MDRRTFLAGSLVAPAASLFPSQGRASTPADALPPAEQAVSEVPDEPGITWFNAQELDVEGRAFHDTAAYFDRLPARAETLVRQEVWTLSRSTAGMAVRFEADTDRIEIDCTLRGAALAMPHMPATGVSGLDLYTRDNGRWRWVSVFQPKDNPLRGPLVEGLARGRREFLLYLPLYNGVESLRLGVPEGNAFAALPPRTDRPILFYGTSITQGACASRPGMAFVSQLGRRLDRPMLNFGFSGQGKMEAQVADLLAELDPAVFVLDCMPNTPAQEVEARSYDVTHRWRRARPETPVVLVESRPWSNADLVQNRLEVDQSKRAAMRRTYDKLLGEGVSRLFYVEGEPLLGDDHEATTDGSHPSDLGMMRIAEALEPVLREALAAS